MKFKKFLRIFAYSLAALVTLVALFYAIENWRGKRAWDRYQRDCEARGVTFDLAALAPAPVPDDQNLAAIPLFTELFPKPPAHPRLDVVILPSCNYHPYSWQAGRAEDLGTYRTYLANQDILAALEPYAAILDEISKAARQRPNCRFPLDYGRGDPLSVLLPHTGPVHNLVSIYRLRALAALGEGDTNAAMADIITGLRLADGLKDEPFLCSYLQRKSMIHSIMQPVWEGLSRQQWTTEQLVTLQAVLEHRDEVKIICNAMLGERLFGYAIGRRWVGGEFDYFGLPLVLRALPRGWIYQNMLRNDQFFSEWCIPMFDASEHRIYPDRQAAALAALDAQRQQFSPYDLIWSMCMPSLFSVTLKAAACQTALDHAALACAIERYRLAHSEYPASLALLVPEFISSEPNDVLTGKPYRYMRTENGRYKLWSVGWNQTDENGELAWNKQNPQQNDPTRGDWVWQYPAKAE